MAQSSRCDAITCSPACRVRVHRHPTRLASLKQSAAHWHISAASILQAAGAPPDPSEARNLINDAAHREVTARMNRQLFDTLEATGGMYIPLAPDRGGIQNLRRRGASGAADFPADVIAPRP